MLIDGKWENSLSGKTFQTINPTTEEKITDIQAADEKDVDRAVRAARKAFDKGEWRSEFTFRRDCLNKLADLLVANVNEIAALESMDNGKPVGMAAMDVMFGSEILRYYAGWTDKI